jgi:hypothetical protein
MPVDVTLVADFTARNKETVTWAFAGRADLSLRALQKVLEVLQAQLVIQTQEQACEQTSVARVEEALALATH